MKRAQTTLASTGFEKYTRTTRRAQFLAEMDRVVPWRALCARIEPVYPTAGNGRRPSAWSACCGCTSSSIGSSVPTTTTTAIPNASHAGPCKPLEQQGYRVTLERAA
jgi:hypothetical protein